jgi:hypothetical protein
MIISAQIPHDQTHPVRAVAVQGVQEPDRETSAMRSLTSSGAGTAWLHET